MPGPAYVVIAEFTVAPERHAAFAAASLDNARGSTGTEPGCRQYDVHVPADGTPRVVLYEVYDDRAAFDAHLQTEHFRRWKALTGDWVQERRSQHLLRQAK